MRKIFSWQLTMTLLLLSASAAVYFIHYLLFHDAHHIFIYMIGDIGFLFLDVLLVILFIEQLLSRREKRTMMKKLNMVIGTFFSEVGLELLRKFSVFVNNASLLEPQLEISSEWKKNEFKKATEAALSFPYNIKVSLEELERLGDFLKEKRSFLLRLLENPNLLEHDRFTDLLWAIFHLAEELYFRGDKLKSIPESDMIHIEGDLKRAFSQITTVWLAYVEHLKESYPFLFSLAARVNPVNPDASPVVI
ncbi:MAG: hypothetical protein ACE5LC_08750 [Candidatus Aminicenantales bacterium]